MRTRSWITAGAVGALGLGIVATGAVAAANALELSDEPATAHGEPVAGAASSDGPVTVRVADDGHASVVSAPTASTTPTASTAPTAVTPATPASAASAPTAVTPASPVSVGSAPSVASAD